jgi:general secretion pathway protein G
MKKEKLRKKGKLQSEKGFTLIEVLLVMAIITVLAAIVVPKFTGRSKDARITAARTDIANIELALDAYEVDNGRYPTKSEGLKALVENRSNSVSWKGPYLKRDVPLDPWGNQYIYILPGRQNTYGYDLYSYGPDKKEGGDDDIDNWSPRKQ